LAFFLLSPVTSIVMGFVVSAGATASVSVLASSPPWSAVAVPGR
jgi:hypothetical protein